MLSAREGEQMERCLRAEGSQVQSSGRGRGSHRGAWEGVAARKGERTEDAAGAWEGAPWPSAESGLLMGQQGED